MSSLAAQLAQSASLNVALLADRSKRKPTESYLFTGRDADQHDLDSVYALATNAFLKLCSVDQRLKRFELALFSDRARALDRTLIGKEEDEKLSDTIGEFLCLLGPWLLEAPTARVIEWLVRRFRVNEFNVESLLALFLPYHDTAQFAKLLTILHIKPNSMWSFLLPFKSAAQNVPRVSLVTEMLRNSDVARFVASLLPSALKENRLHRVLLAFNAATMHEFIFRSKTLSEGTMAYILPAVLEPLEKRPDASRDAILGSFILLSALSQKCELSASALKVIIGSMAACAQMVTTRQFISAAIAVCEPQTELEMLSGSTAKAILKIPDIKEELQAATGWVGSEKLVQPLVMASVSRLPDNHASVLLESIISTPSILPSIVECTAKLLIKEALSQGNIEKATVARSLLSNVQQRHPEVFQRATQAEQDDEELKKSIDQLVLSLSLVSTAGSQSKEEVDMVLASTSADTNIRVIAVKELLSSLSNGSLTTADQQTVTSALISRLQDPEQQVLEALYERPKLIAPLFATDASTCISTLAASLGSKPKRGFLRLHLAFVLKHLYPILKSECKEEIISEVLFPFLLFSKPRQHTAETVWDIIAESLGEENGKEFEMLRGCANVVKTEREKAGEDTVEKMRSMNAALAAQIAQNILKSNRLFELLPIILSKLESVNPHTRALGYLVANALLSKLSGEHQVDVASRVLEVVKLEEISGVEDLGAEHDTALETLKENAEKSVILKPSRQSTLSWLQISLVATICSVPSPEGLVVNWLSDQSSSDDTRGPRYVALMRSIYNFANHFPSLPVLISCLLHIFFLNLKSDALVFLAGVWTTPTSNDNAALHEIALRHAAAFLEAHVLEDDGMDFQTIVPALLVALQNSSIGVRKAAVECLSRIRLISGRKLRSVYKFDAVYGDVKDTLQYLEQDDLKRYLAHLVAHQQHFTQDQTYLRVTHAEHLKPVKGDKKKDVEYKNSILYYLLSHVNAIDLESTKIKILESLHLVSSNVKAICLLPSIEALQTHQVDVTLACLLVSSVDASSVAQLNDAEGGLWEAYIQVLEQYLRPSSNAAPRETLIRLLETEVFAQLKYERQVTVCEVIIGVVAREPDAQAYGKKLLSSIIKEIPLIVELLEIYTPAPQGNTPRVAKRARTTDTTEGDNTMPQLSLLAEVLGTKDLPGSLNLVSALLEALSKLLQSTPDSETDVNYVEQMLMSAIDSTASNILESPNVTPSVIRLDVLMEVIRVVGNPQTFHQALLLMASLARLAPESVLNNVMPVFTFMGSNVFHRDDTYSFRVVQKTIDGIVPVMASSLKSANADSLDLHIASRDFLRVFTDAANHIPRYRRNNFFVHLVEVLGAEHFLAPVCMLLVAKSSNRVVKQSQEEATATLALPIALLHHVTPTIQVTALVEFLKESQRLVTCAVDPANKTPMLLDHILDGESAAGAYVKRAQALITMIGRAIEPKVLVNLDNSGKELLSFLISGLIGLVTLGNNVSGVKLGGLVIAAQATLKRVLNAVPAASFVDATTSMLALDNTVIRIGALELLSERIPKIADHIRREITATTNSIVELTIKLLAQDNIALQVHCLKSLKAVASTLVPKEESTITTALPSILATSNVPDLVVHALDALIPLTTKLGPRIIPFFKDIITKSVALLKDADNAVLEKTTAILHGLLTSIPAFWGTDALTQMVNLYMNHYKSTSGFPKSPMSSLMKTITKKVPPKVLLPSLMDIWTTAASSRDLDHITAYSDVLTRTLRHAPRASVLEQTRGLSNIFLEAFDIIKPSGSKESKAETQVISAFREFVVKLNESTFRPVFRRLYDWAFVNETADTSRKTVFFHTYSGLLDFFKALMVPYTSFLLPALDLHLKSFTDSTDEESSTLWSSLVATLTKTLSYDDGGFWRDDKLRQIASPLIQQVPLCTKLPAEIDARALFQQCLDALVEDVSDDALLKNINLELLMHTRSENVKVRQFALACSESLWRTHGGKLLGFVSETATFIAECGEDENDTVVKESFRLKDAVENVAGKIDGL